jgi:hypothetical protein
MLFAFLRVLGVEVSKAKREAFRENLESHSKTAVTQSFASMRMNAT